MLFNKNYKNNNLKNLLHVITLALVILFFISINSSAQSQSRVINFQGRLTDQHGNSLDGTYDIIFSIYSSDPNSGPLWTERHTEVNVSSGIVNVLLGSITSFDDPQKVTFDEERYLGITVDCDHDPNTKEPELSPRQRILPAIYSYDSYNADRLDGMDSNEFTTPETDAGRPGVAEHLYEGNTRLIDKYLGRVAQAQDADKLDGYHATISGGDNNAIPVINSGVTYNNLRVGFASQANSASNADKLDGYDASAFIGTKGCYISYSGGCLSGFSNMGSAGSWGLCRDNSGGGHFRPPGGGCYNAAWPNWTIGTAYVCCR
ncbi:MAG: hypothetical protein ACMUHX_10745 [bacterium]